MYGFLCCALGLALLLAVGSCSALDQQPELKLQYLCPDNKSLCYVGHKCCPFKAGGYGCCSVANKTDATCCYGPVDYCCDEFQCSFEGQGSVSCDNMSPTGWPVSFPADELLDPVNAQSELTTQIGLVCPDAVTACPFNRTCCKRSDGSYDCCSSPGGVCCADDSHCCPSNYYCYTDYNERNCGSKTISQDHIDFSNRFPPVNVTDLKMCPDNVSHCPNGHTCCANDSSEDSDRLMKYSCCEFPDAVCCSNKKHCCPSGYVCDETDKLCIKK